MLRQRFLVALLPLPLLFLGAGVYALFLLSNLSRSIDAIIDRPLNSIVAAEEMKKAGLQMQAAVALALQADDDAATAAFPPGATNFENSLRLESENLSVPGDEFITRQLEKTFRELRASWQALLAATPPNRDLPANHFLALIGTAVKMADDIRTMNDDAIRWRKAEAQYACKSSRRLLVVAMVAAGVIWTLLSARLARIVLRPVRALTRSLQKIGADQAVSPLSVLSADELGTLVEEFNEMSVRMEAYRNSDKASVVRAQQILQATLAAFPDPIYVLSPDLRIELQNAAAYRLAHLLNYPNALPEPLVERAQQVAANRRDYLPSHFQDALMLRVDNEERYFLPKIVAMSDATDKPLGVAVVLEDVTQFRLMDELKSNLISTVSHEIKTPLTSIRMSIHLLQDHSVGPLEPKQAALIDAAREDVERLLRLLNHLLEMARFEHGSPQMHWEKVSARELIDDAVDEVLTLSAARRLILRVNCPEGLPTLYIDRARVSHVLRNLLTNAINHSPEGAQILLAVSLADNAGVHFSIRDQGSGIPEEHQPRIFEKFYRVPGQKIQGSGLGLSIARDIILAHFGTIGCHSEPGRQTTFFFTLPNATEQQQRLASSAG
jgi:signal transduction histidine kinase